MISEIYAKLPDDVTFQEDFIIHSDVYESILQKVRMILFTNRGEILGDPNFGVSLTEYVFALNASNQTIKKEIEEQISHYIPEALYIDISVNVTFRQENFQDVCYIDIRIDGTDAMRLLVS